MKIVEKIRFPIVLKLSAVAALLLLAAAVAIAYQSYSLIEKRSEARERDANVSAADAKAAQVSVLLDRYRDKTRLVATLLFKQQSGQGATTQDALEMSFFHDPDFVALEIFELENGTPKSVNQIQKNDFFKKHGLSGNYLKGVRALRRFPVESVFAGQIEVKNSSLSNGVPLLTIGIPFVKNEAGFITHVAVSDLRLDGLQKSFARVTDRSFYLVDREGMAIAHPDEKLVLEGQSLKNREIVKKAIQSKVMQGEVKYLDSSLKKNYVGSFAQTQFGPIVISQVPEDTILEAARQVRRDTFKITGFVLSAAIFFVFLFSTTLTNPIEKLVEMTRKVAAGNFDVQARIRSQDEVGVLASSFNIMVHGLKERDKMRNVLNKFHGSAVSEDLLKGDLELGGVNKQVTVFFSDIRDFTKFSEGHTPEQVVEMLNEYFEIMVDIVTRNHGVVDKFVGDAMMAIWGAPNSTGEDEKYAVKACLEMRQALEELNRVRIGRGQVEIRMGMGLNSGPAISGTIGSSERMEYTVIGDTVNTASRIEASTKAFGTDLLISGDTLEKVKESYITEFAGSAEVKGKSEPLSMYKVLGYIDASGNSVFVKTPYSDYAASNVEKVKIA